MDTDDVEEVKPLKTTLMSELLEDALIDELRGSPVKDEESGKVYLKRNPTALNVARLYLKDQGFVAESNTKSKIRKLQDAVRGTDEEAEYPFPVSDDRSASPS